MFGSILFFSIALTAQSDSDPRAAAIAESLRYVAADRSGGPRQNTLVMKISESDGQVQAALFKFRELNGATYRERLSKSISVPSSEWNNPSSFAQIPSESLLLEESDAGGVLVRVKHRELERFDQLINANQSPIRFALVNPDSSRSAIVCDPEPNTMKDVDQILKAAQEKSDSKSDQKDPRAAAKATVLEQLKLDLEWQAGVLDSIIDREGVRDLLKKSLRGGTSDAAENAQRDVMKEFLKEAAENPSFQNDPGRLDNLMLYNTLYGEFRRKDPKGNHRTLAHLFWASESVRNRLRYPPKKANRRNRLQSVQSSYLTLVPKDQRGLFNNRLTGVVLSSRQYSAFNPGEATLSDILLRHSSKISPQIQTDLSDFIAAYVAGYIKVSKGAPPRITHYVSPRSLPQGDLGPDYPEFWSKEQMTIFKGGSSLPAVYREDLDKARSQSVLSTEPGTDESRIDPDWFEGGLERW